MCPTFRNTYPEEENSFSGRNQSNCLFPDHNKGDDYARFPHAPQGGRNSSFPYSESTLGFTTRIVDPEIVIDATVFRGMSRLHQRDGLFLQKIGVLRIRG